jgi:hypothetical protein
MARSLLELRRFPILNIIFGNERTFTRVYLHSRSSGAVFRGNNNKL